MQHASCGGEFFGSFGVGGGKEMVVWRRKLFCFRAHKRSAAPSRSLKGIGHSLFGRVRLIEGSKLRIQ